MVGGILAILGTGIGIAIIEGVIFKIPVFTTLKIPVKRRLLVSLILTAIAVVIITVFKNITVGIIVILVGTFLHDILYFRIGKL